MITIVFGLPGCGKSTYLCKLAKEYNKKNFVVYSNIDLFGLDHIKIENSDIGKYDISDGVLLIDEAMLFVNSRDYKSFSKSLVSFFCQYRHFNLDIFLFTQRYDGLDVTIRSLADRFIYLRKSHLRSFTKIIPISCGYMIPEDVPDEIKYGFRAPSRLSQLFCKRFWRKPYYKYFNSFERYYLPSLDTKNKDN